MAEPFPFAPPDPARILFLGRPDVIGLTGYLARRADAYFRLASAREKVPAGMKPLTLRELLRLRAKVRAGHYDLVICCAIDDPLWRVDRGWFANIRKVLSKLFRRADALAYHLVPWMLSGATVPLAVYDWDDNTIIGRKNWGLLARSTCYFKTQTPRNPYKAFLFQDRKNDCIFNILRQPIYAAWAEKLRPFSVGISIPENEEAATTLEKKTDIFFAGPVGYSTVRAEGVLHLEALRAEGFRIDLHITDAQARLTPEEFRRRCAEAWLVWSPEGAGWDCARHYWAPLMGSVPLLNHPDTRRHRPHLDGEHAFYYGVEGDDLQRVARRALADKPRLREMAAAADAHIRAHHTVPALADYLMAETLATAGKKKTVLPVATAR